MTREQAIEEIRYYCQDSEKIIKALDQETCKDSVSRKAILSKIKEVCFSDKWLQFRVNKGSHGQRDFIIDYIEKLPPVTPNTNKKPCEDSVSRKAVLNLAKDLDFSGVKVLEHYKHRCIEIEDVEQLPPVTPDLSSLREINRALTERVKYLEDMEKYATPKTFIHRDRTVQDFVEKCRECGRQKTGKWIRVDHNKVKCSECEITHLIAQYPHGAINYCPNCGAEMETKENDK